MNGMVGRNEENGGEEWREWWLRMKRMEGMVERSERNGGEEWREGEGRLAGCRRSGTHFSSASLVGLPLLV